MKAYNLVLYPEAEEARATFFAAAAPLREVADDYCLEQGIALPHITLCPFEAEDDAQALAAAEGLLPQSLSVTVCATYIEPSRSAAYQKFWIGYRVLLEPDLLALRHRLYETITPRGVTIDPEPQDYFPHFTLARTTLCDLALPVSLTANALARSPVACRLSLGESGPHGILKRILAY